MTLKRTLSFCLALTLILSILAPCGVLTANAATTLYGEKELEQVVAPEIGESYYLAASAGEEIIYFRHGSVTETTPYSLATSRSINHNWVVKVTLEDSTLTQEKEAGYFQLTYTNPSNGNTSRIYCYDVVGKDGVMDTGANSANYKNRHSFIIDDIDGLKVLRKVGNNNILVAKEMEYTRNVTDAEGNTTVQTGTEWRILGVPEADLGNDGVHPVMLLTEHAHAYNEITVDAESNSASRVCSCGKAITVYDQKVTAVDEPQIGGSYHLTANVNGTIRYFIHGTVTETSPASLRTSDNLEHNWAFPVSIEAPVEGDEGFQMTYVNPSSATVRIYCYDAIGKDGIMDTGVNSKSTLATHTFFVDEANGVKLLRQIDNNSILVVKEVEFSRNVTDAEGNTSVQTGTEWRILGVDESELANEGVYPVFLSEKHTHTAYGETYQVSDSGHSPICWCGGYADPIAHTYGAVTADAANNTHSRSCSVCGYTNVIYSQKYEQVNTPKIGETYYLAANVAGQLLSCNVAGGGYTGTSPYSLKTTSTIYSFTLNKALQEGKGEFQLVDENGKYLYSVAAGAGATVSSGYVNDPAKVSFSMDTVNGQTVLRAYGTQNILVVKYSDALSAWRMWCLPESELANVGVYPVVLLDTHEHTAGQWSFDTENGTQSRNCTVCGAVAETLYGTDNKVSMAADPQVGDSYYLSANVNGKIYYFRHGTATDTVPYSLVVTSDFGHSWVMKVTLEDYTATSDGATEGFQLTYTNPSNSALTRIYCYDVLKDATVAGQTGVMDTGINTVCYKNRHTFVLAEINGQTVIQKTSNNNVLVVKLVPQTVDGKTTNVLRMLGVPASELGSEGVYPVMLANAHTHSFETHHDDNGHWSVCDCGSRTPVGSHNYASWTLDAEALTQSADCSVCGYSLTVASPYFDTVDSEEELQNGLAGNVYDEETELYSVVGGNNYYLTTEKDGQRYYFRLTVKTAAGNTESVTTTDAYSLYLTNDPNHIAITPVNVSAGYTKDTYILSYTTDKTRALYVNDEGKDGDIDTGITTFNGALNSPTYISRVECLFDDETGVLYHVENGEKYILVMKELSATYKVTDPDTNETTVVEGPVNEWRIMAVPAEDATAENGCYILKLAQHIHNYPAQYSTDNYSHWKTCPCGYVVDEEHTVEQWTVIAPPSETETGSKSGECTVCGATVTVETPITVSSWNIVLGDSIGVGFVLALAEGDEVSVAVNGEEVPAELIDNGDGTYKVFVELAAAQMADEIAITVNGYALEKTYSVRDYADTILAGEFTSYEKALVQNMLVYGGSAQRYFLHNTGNYADEGINVTAAVPGEAEELVIVDELESIKFYGASLVNRNKTAVRFYFTADSVEGLSFQVDGNTYEPVGKDGMYYIEVAGINPQDLDDTLSVFVTDGTGSLAVQYSPLLYISRVYNTASTPDALKALLQAMYGYHLAAKTYLANLNLSDDFALKSQTQKSLYEGVELYEKTYVAAGYGEVKANIIAVDADANVELKVSAGAWDETNNAENPAEAMTVVKHFRAVKNAGYNVLGMINGGFFDLNNTKSYLPYGMQVVDGVVKQAPSSTANSYSNNWFGMTKDGKYVISDAAGYESTYVDNVQQAVGGGKLLIVDGIPVDLTSERAYRTAVGVNANGDLVMVAVEDATYSDVCHIFVDMNMEILTVLNLDGGGSTAMYVPGTYYPKALILGEDGLLPREVADAVAIVEKQ